MSRSTRLQSCEQLAANPAERLLALGRRVHQCLRVGDSLDLTSRRLRRSRDGCRLALALFKADIRLQLQSLIEDWSYPRILLELRGSEALHAERAPATLA